MKRYQIKCGFHEVSRRREVAAIMNCVLREYNNGQSRWAIWISSEEVQSLCEQQLKFLNLSGS